jgi:hypothetical protein
VARQRTTLGKLQRDRDKQARAKAKQEKRLAAAADRDDAGGGPAPAADQAAVLDALTRLHAEFEDGGMSLDDFEARRDELTRRLRID